MKIISIKLKYTSIVALTIGLALNVPADSISYVKPVYKGTDNNPADGIAYWVTNSVSDYTIVGNASQRQAWGTENAESWYVVPKGTYQIDGGVICYGDVHLVLCDDAKLVVTNCGETFKGISKAKKYSLLTIYSQHIPREIITNSHKLGELISYGGKEASGIGANNITINGGKITAIGGERGASIGGNHDNNGKNITINGGIINAIGGINAAAIGGGVEGQGANITISSADVFVTTSSSSESSIASDHPQFIGNGLNATDNAYNNTITDTARIFFNMTNKDIDVDKWIESVSGDNFENFVIITPMTQTVSHVLVGGWNTNATSTLSTCVLTNSITGSTTNITINASKHIDFAYTYLRLTNEDGNLTLKVDPPDFTINQQPTIENSYKIKATTDGNNGITNYAWSAYSQTELDFHSLTNCIYEDESIYGDINETTIYSIDFNGTHFLVLGLMESKGASLPKNGTLIFEGPSNLISFKEDYCKLTQSVGNTWICEQGDAFIDSSYYALALNTSDNQPFAITNLHFEVESLTPVAEGKDLTTFPTDKGIVGSNYLCQVTYGHYGTFYTANSEIFKLKSFTYPNYLTGLPQTMQEKFDDWATNFGSRDPDSIYANAFLLNVAPGDEAKAIAAFKISYIDMTNEDDTAVIKVGKPVPLAPSTFFNGELWYQCATNLATNAVWTDLEDGSYVWDTNTFFRAKLDLTPPEAQTIPKTPETGRNVKFQPVENN